MAPKPNKNTLEEEKSVVFGHSVVFDLEFSIKERQDNPAGTSRKYNVASTSMQSHDVASTLRRRYIYVMCLPGSLLRCIGCLRLIKPLKGSYACTGYISFIKNHSNKVYR